MFQKSLVSNIPDRVQVSHRPLLRNTKQAIQQLLTKEKRWNNQKGDGVTTDQSVTIFNFPAL